MPIVRGGTDAIAIPEAKVQTASLQYRKRVIPGARHVILGATRAGVPWPRGGPADAGAVACRVRERLSSRRVSPCRGAAPRLPQGNAAPARLA